MIQRYRFSAARNYFQIIKPQDGRHNTKNNTRLGKGTWCCSRSLATPPLSSPARRKHPFHWPCLYLYIQYHTTGIKNKYFNSSFSHGFYSYFHRLFLKEKALPSHLLSTVHVEVQKNDFKNVLKRKTRCSSRIPIVRRHSIAHQIITCAPWCVSYHTLGNKDLHNQIIVVSQYATNSLVLVYVQWRCG